MATPLLRTASVERSSVGAAPAVLVAVAAAIAVVAAVVVASTVFAGPVLAQAPERPVLRGTAFVGDAEMTEGVVVLHHLSDGEQGDLDSLRVSEDGGFAFRLPSRPDPTRNDIFFASVRHDGVLYFGPAITQMAQLDSAYEIHAYDTLLAPVAGMPVPLQSRSVFFEPDSAGWRVTDLFQLRNDEPRTIVTRSDGIVWSHPLPAEAKDVSAGEGELAFDAAEYEDGALVVRAALPPGERLFVVRYRVDSPLLSLPNRGPTETLDVLIREPAPPIAVEGLELVDRIELEAGSTYLRFVGTDVTATEVRIVATEGSEPPRVQWAAFLLAMVLAASGLLVLRTGGTAPQAASALDRQALLVAIARLDEDFARGGHSEADRQDYERRRAGILHQVGDAR